MSVVHIVFSCAPFVLPFCVSFELHNCFEDAQKAIQTYQMQHPFHRILHVTSAEDKPPLCPTICIGRRPKSKKWSTVVYVETAEEAAHEIANYLDHPIPHIVQLRRQTNSPSSPCMISSPC